MPKRRPPLAPRHRAQRPPHGGHGGEHRALAPRGVRRGPGDGRARRRRPRLDRPAHHRRRRPRGVAARRRGGGAGRPPVGGGGARRGHRAEAPRAGGGATSGRCSARRSGSRSTCSILEKAHDVSFSRFEDPEFNNKMTQARREAGVRPWASCTGAVSLARDLVTFVGYAALLLVARALGHRGARARRAARVRGRSVLRAPVVRPAGRAHSAQSPALLPGGRAHQRGHGEGGEALRPRPLAHRGLPKRSTSGSTPRRDSLSRRTRSVALRALDALVHARALRRVPAHRVAGRRTGLITLGAMTLYVTVFRAGQSALAGAPSRPSPGCTSPTSTCRPSSASSASSPTSPRRDPAPRRSRHARPPRVVFEEVSYRYPGTPRDVLHHVTLTLEAGRDGRPGRAATGRARPRW